MSADGTTGNFGLARDAQGFSLYNPLASGEDSLTQVSNGSFAGAYFTNTVSQDVGIPEPASGLIVAVGAVGVIAMGRRRQDLF